MNGEIERTARRMAAKKMGIRDYYGSRLPDELWMQCVPQAQHERRIATLVELRRNLEAMHHEGRVFADWEVSQMIAMIDETREHETLEDRKIRVRFIGMDDLTEEEVDLLDNPESARKWRAQRAAERACPGHERVSTETHDEGRRGWHPGKCKHCGKDMSYDSGD